MRAFIHFGSYKRRLGRRQFEQQRRVYCSRRRQP
uniref:Uncharacterized protein n=1 Tax=Romanomermis culicivorax TaxID=13658 RepID=A0A915IP51_ROMCU